MSIYSIHPGDQAYYHAGRLKKISILLFVSLLLSFVDKLAAQTLDDLIRQIQGQNFSEVVRLAERADSIQFSPTHMTTRVFSGNSTLRTRSAEFEYVNTTASGYLMHSLFAALSSGQEPSDRQSKAFFLIEVFKELQKRGQNIDPVFQGSISSGEGKEFAISGMIDTALTRNDRELLESLIPTLEALGFSQNHAFKSFDPYNGDSQDVSLPSIGINALFESSLGDQGVENSARLFDGARFLFDAVSDEAHTQYALEERRKAEKAVNEIAANLRAGGHEMTPQERSLMITRQLHWLDMPLRLAVIGGFSLNGFTMNLSDPSQSGSTAEESQHISEVRLPTYLQAIRRQIGDAKMRSLMNAPIFPIQQEAVEPGGPDVILYSPFGLATESQTPQNLKQFLGELGGSSTERAAMFGHRIQVEVGGQTQNIDYPVFGMNQISGIMNLAIVGDMSTLRQMSLSFEEANSQSPDGFRPTALHMALGGAAARFKSLPPQQRREVLRSESNMAEFLSPVVDTTRLLLERGADPDTVSGYFGPEGQIWYNVTEGTPIDVADALATALVEDFDQARVRLGRSKRQGIPEMAQPESGVCKGLLRHLGRAGWLKQ